MLQIRSLLFYIGLTVSTLFFGLSLSLLGWLMSLNFRQRINRYWAQSVLWQLRVICRLDYEISGAEHLPTGAAIVMAKHQSAWETIALRAIVQLRQSWILKRELLRIPVFGWGLALTNNIPIDRSAGREAIRQLTKEGRQRLAQDMTVMVFPEGTRTAPGQRRKYHVGAGILAAKTGVPVIPIAHNAGVFWRRRGFVKYPGCIQVVVGAPIDSQGKSTTEIMTAVEEWIEDVQTRLPLETGDGAAMPVDNP